MELPLPGWSIAQKATWFREYLNREIERALREQATRDKRRDRSETVACSECGTSFELSRRRASAGSPVCRFCRHSSSARNGAAPDESDRRWVANIPNESLDGLLAAVESLRRQI